MKKREGKAVVAFDFTPYIADSL